MKQNKIFYLITTAACFAIICASGILQTDGQKIYFKNFSSPLNCFLYNNFHIKCALCGLTRSFIYTAHADLPRAFAAHHLGPAIFIFVLLQIPINIILYVKNEKINWLCPFNTRALILLIVMIILNWFIYLGGLLL